MDLAAARAQLAANAAAIAALVRPVGDAEARWKPTPDDWSILEVVCHLADEERDDFGTRVRLTLDDPTLPWPPIDPGGWVTSRDYAARDLAAALADFMAERDRTLAWLDGLAGAGAAPAWTNAARHPAGFTIRAGDLMASWLAHDLLHLRQLVELRYGVIEQGVGSDGGTADCLRDAPLDGGGDGDGRWDVRYAGEW